MDFFFLLWAFTASCRVRSALHHSSHLLFSSSLCCCCIQAAINSFCLCKVSPKAAKEQHEETLKSCSAYFVMNKSSQMWRTLSVWACFVLWGRQKCWTSGSADEKENQRRGWAWRRWWWWWWRREDLAVLAEKLETCYVNSLIHFNRETSSWSDEISPMGGYNIKAHYKASPLPLGIKMMFLLFLIYKKKIIKQKVLNATCNPSFHLWSCDNSTLFFFFYHWLP